MSPNLRLRRLIIIFAAGHLVLALGSLATSYTLGMSRFDAAASVDSSALESVATDASNVLFQPATFFLGISGPGSHSSFVQWFALGCNSLLWGLGLALVFWCLTLRLKRTHVRGARAG